MFLQKLVFTFYSELLIQRLHEVSHGCMLSAPPNQTLIKWRGGFIGAYFSVLTFSLSPSGKFSADALVCTKAYKGMEHTNAYNFHGVEITRRIVLYSWKT